MKTRKNKKVKQRDIDSLNFKEASFFDAPCKSPDVIYQFSIDKDERQTRLAKHLEDMQHEDDVKVMQNQLYAEIDGIERCLGLVDQRIDDCKSSCHLLQLALDCAHLYSDRYLKLEKRLAERKVKLKTLQNMRKSFLHFIRQCSNCINELYE